MGDKLDRETMERVLRRAQELADADPIDAEPPGVVDEQVLIEAAAEAGIDPAAVRRSLALERLPDTTEPAVADRIVGPKTIVASTVVEAPSDEVLALLDAWLSASGKLVACDEKRIVIRVDNDRVSHIHVHFPRIGYRLSKPKR